MSGKDKAELYYQEQGEGMPLVLLHGNGENSGYFEHQLSYFSKKYRVIALDTRGHGRSLRGKAPFTLEQFAEDLKEFLDAKGLNRINLLGFSDGGNIALLFALKYPQYVNRLILNGANLRPSGVKAYVQLPIVIGYGIASACAGMARSAKGALAHKEMLGLMVTQPKIQPQELRRLSCPALVIVGTRDMIRDSHSELIAKSLPNARLVRIEGDHFIAAKKSKEFNRAVEEFLSDSEEKAGGVERIRESGRRNG
ncbi:MAG: alpha/beta hydrolase [Lachnospiraceae bacterium]|nr:alpha/beta hydrolase [Lachnospiraceae bacterium]